MPSLGRSPDRRYLRTVIVTDVVLIGIRDRRWCCSCRVRSFSRRAVVQALALAPLGGTGRTRTGNLLDAIEALSSLSYGPIDWTRSRVDSESSRVERRGIAPRSLQCECSVLLLNYRPSAGREGIEPSLRGLEARLVTMTLRPVLEQRRAARTVASSIARSASYGNRTRLTP